MRVADYIFSYLADLGLKHVFMVSGGGAMHLNDALGREKRIQYICNHHEQASAIAAEAYARITNHLGVICVTTGPGGINALNGVFGAWTDSIPMLVISGQVKSETCLGFHDLPKLRQLGDQEVDIIAMSKPITKYAELVKSAEDIRFHLEKAIHLATTGRKGPCWLDIPIDIQATKINPRELKGFQAATPIQNKYLPINEIVDKIKNSSRPTMLIGSGIRLSNSQEELKILKTLLKIPIVSSWTGSDLIEDNDELFCGIAGTVGNRSGNFTVQNSDFLLVLGSRLNIRQISYNWKIFADKAFIVHVDIDEEELNKPTLNSNLKICSDLRIFLNSFLQKLKEEQIDPKLHQEWLKWCKERQKKYPVLQQRQLESKLINPYYFINRLKSMLTKDDIIACGDGSACVIGIQTGHNKLGQTLFTNSGCASMGYDLPAAIGATFASNKEKRVICLAGDGSIQMNIQELQTIVHHNLPIKIFVINNAGYLSIKLTQKNFFESNFVGSSTKDLSFPDLVKLGTAYGFKSFRLESKESLETQLKEIIELEGPVLCEVIVDSEQEFEPKLSSRVTEDGKMHSSRLEDMYPFLDSLELKSNLIE